MPLRVALVGADGELWSGDASMVLARTLEGDVGLLPGHVPLLGVLAAGPVEIRPAGGSGAVRAEVDGGFLSLADDAVSILVEQASLSS